MEVKSTKELHSELAMHSVRFAKDEQGRRKGQDVLFKWPEIERNSASTSIFTSSMLGLVRTITPIACGTT